MTGEASGEDNAPIAGYTIQNKIFIGTYIIHTRVHMRQCSTPQIRQKIAQLASNLGNDQLINGRNTLRVDRNPKGVRGALEPARPATGTCAVNRESIEIISHKRGERFNLIFVQCQICKIE